MYVQPDQVFQEFEWVYLRQQECQHPNDLGLQDAVHVPGRNDFDDSSEFFEVAFVLEQLFRGPALAVDDLENKRRR
jgi:hypothetical protein